MLCACAVLSGNRIRLDRKLQRSFSNTVCHHGESLYSCRIQIQVKIHSFLRLNTQIYLDWRDYTVVNVFCAYL